jgi:hypothetical protein
LQSVRNNLTAATNSIAAHYHAIALDLERAARKEFGSEFKAKGTKGTDEFVSSDERDRKAIRKALATFRVNIGTEIAYLQQNKGWDKDKMPSACDSAVRKIYKAWENNFSLEVLQTCSKVGKANSDLQKEVDAAIAGVGQQVLAAQQGEALALTGHEEIDKVLSNIINNAKSWADADSKSALSNIEAYDKKLSNILASVALRRVS